MLEFVLPFAGTVLSSIFGAAGEQSKASAERKAAEKQAETQRKIAEEELHDIKADTDRSTAESVLKRWIERYESEEAALVRDYRKGMKLANTYIRGPANNMDERGLIYPKTNQTGTSTGRFSMERPSLNNLPAREDPKWTEELMKVLHRKNLNVHTRILPKGPRS